METTVNKGGRPRHQDRKLGETIRMRDSMWDKMKDTYPNSWRSTCGQWLETLVENDGPNGFGLGSDLTQKIDRKAKIMGMTREDLITLLVDNFDTTAIEEATRRAVQEVLNPSKAVPTPAPTPIPAATPDFSRFFPTQPQMNPQPSFPEPLPPVTIGFGPK